jgi:hypothetical protein
MNRDDLIDELLDRRRVLVTDWRQFRAEHLPRMTRVLIGRMAYTDVSDPAHSVRYIDVESWPYSPHELASVYLRRCVAASRARQAWASGAELGHLRIPHPLYWHGGEVRGDLVYLDLRRAYWSIYSRVGRLDAPLIVRPDSVSIGRGMIALPDADMWRSTPLGRDAVVGIARATRFMELHRGEPTIREGPSRVTAPRLWRLLALVLHGVAAEMVALGAVCVHTDGYILPATCLPAARACVRSWGLEARVKGRGEGVVTGIGSYTVGGFASARLGPPRPAISNLLDLSPGQRASLAQLLVDR